jgi:hypothetical protein
VLIPFREVVEGYRIRIERVRVAELDAELELQQVVAVRGPDLEPLGSVADMDRGLLLLDGVRRLRRFSGPL